MAMQLQLIHDETAEMRRRIVNVASVPKRSPFRYPGGKTWLVPRIREWLISRPIRPALLVEPFAGGGIVSLTVAFEQLADHVLMVEMDEQVAAVWQVILGGEGQWLADAIMDFNLTSSNVETTLAQKGGNIRDRAFRTLLKNRVNRGGILAPGAGIIKHGENGKGLASRWYPNTLRRRILAISSVRDRFTFIQGDGIEVMRQYAERADVVSFIDPPYTAGGNGKRAGTRLYTHNQLNHEVLFATAATLDGDFLMTYDNDAEVCSLAAKYSFETEQIAMKNTHHTEMTELLVGRDLSWIRSL